MIRILSWNIARREKCWEDVFESDYDIALLQEANKPQIEIPSGVEISPGEWHTAGVEKRNWRTAIVKLSDKVNVEWISCKSIETAGRNDLAVSRLGSLAIAKVTPRDGGESTFVVSCYSVWEKSTTFSGANWIYADASVHRVISDISGLIGSEKKHRILLAGDFNSLNCYGENGNIYWGNRYTSIFDRFEAIGIPFLGPKFPNGRQSKPWPKELPEKSECVPTFHTIHQTPESATRQLDFVFASENIFATVLAKNGIEEWGASDHCRLEITL